MGRFVAVVGLAVLLGCDPQAASFEASATGSPGAASQDVRARGVPLPQTASDFIREVVDWAGGSIEIEYRATGPGGLTGTMQLRGSPGYQRLDWSYGLPLGIPRIEGARIERPDAIWSSSIDGAPAVEPVPLQQLADAYEKLEPEARRRVVENVRRWKASVARLRAEETTTVRVAGVSCAEAEVAGAQVCIEPTTGMALRYEGAGFLLEATTVRRGRGFDAEIFAVPDDAAPEDATGAFDPQASLERIGAGDWAELVVLNVAPLVSLGSTG